MPQCKNCGSELPEGAAFCPKCGASAGVTAELRLAYWGDRFVAWLIDIVIVGIAVAAIRYALQSSWPGISLTPALPFWIPFVDFGLGNVIHFLYWLFMDGAYGQSLGKMLMRIKVVNLEGQPIDMTQAAIESVGKAFILPLDLILGWIFHPRRRQRVFNYVSNTIVIKVRR